MRRSIRSLTRISSHVLDLRPVDSEIEKQFLQRLVAAKMARTAQRADLG